MWLSQAHAELLLREKENEIKQILKLKERLREDRVFSVGLPLKAARQKEEVVECNGYVERGGALTCALGCCDQ